MYSACLFDLDGTLADTLADLAEATNHLLRAQGYPTHEAARYRYFVGNGVPKLIERALPETARTEAILARSRELFDAYYAAHYLDHTAPYPGIPVLLEALAGQGVHLAVVTNKPDGFARQIIASLFGARFAVVLGSRPGVPRKPDPAAALEAAGALDAAPGACLFIGDSGVDMQTAQAAGMTGVGVLWGFRDSAELLAGGAKKLISRPDELLRLF